MQIAVDGRRLQVSPPDGVGRGLRNLLPRLAEAAEIHVLVDDRQPPADLAVLQHRLRTPLVARSSVWLQVAVPRWLRRFDGVFHSPFYGLPFAQPVPMVVTIHDIVFETNPEWFSAGRRLAFRVQARHAARTARRVVTVSEYVKGLLTARYDVDPDRIVVCPNAVDPVFGPDGGVDRGSGLVRALGVTKPYVVALGGSPRRGLSRAVAAWRQARGAGGGVDLVVVGPETPPSEPGLVAAGPLPDRPWAAVLAGARAFCYPTATEGFGLPALEAAASGTPVVCAPVGALPEVLGDSAEWCASPSAEDVGAGLARLLEDDARADVLRQRGLRRAAAWPGWDQAAATLLDACRAAAEEAP